MNIEQPLLSILLSRDSDRSTSAGEYEAPTAMALRDVVAAVGSGALDLDDTASMDSALFCRVCLVDKHVTS